MTRLWRERAPLELILYGRDDCHLCDVADEALQRAGRRIPLTVHHVDIDTDPELAEKYGTRVPVVTTVDGDVLCEGKVSETRVRASLRKIAQGR